MSDLNQPVTKEYAVYKLIRQAIIDGELVPGQPVSIRELAARFSYGRTPVSEAMKRLSLEGWLETTSGIGTRVTDINLADRYEYMQVRGELEVLAARLCAENASAEDMLDFDHCIAVANLAIEQKNWQAAIEADIEFHRLCAEKSGNHFLSDYYSRLLAHDERVFYRNLPDPDARIQSHEQHQAIVDAVKAHDPSRAADAARVHTETILKRLKRDQGLLSAT
jgi:DNA-binding GntR family transcriptional regulator